MAKRTILIDGGMGRVLCAEPALKRLIEEGHDLSVLTSWPDIFKNHPTIKKVFPLTHPNQWDSLIKNSEFLFPDPYNNHLYYNKKHHLVQSFDFLINGDTNPDFVAKPAIYLSKEEISEAQKVMTEMISHHGSAAFTIIIQPFGSNSKVIEVNNSLYLPREERRLDSEEFKAARTSSSKECVDYTNRGLSFKDLAKILDRLDGDFLVLNFSNIKFEHPRLFNVDVDLRMWFALIYLSDYFIGVDSIGQHVAAAFDVPGHVFYGGTSPKNLAWPEIHKIIQNDGFPVEYQPCRQDFNHCVNDKAMELNDETIALVCEEINKRFFG